MTETEQKAMTKTERKAIVWDRVEQSAFRPEDKKESWLRRYSQQLRNLLQLPLIWIKDGSQGHFQIAELKIACKYRIESPDAYVACLKKMKDERTIWSIHVDANYLSKSALHMAKVDYPETEFDTHLRSDIASVLDGMLFHPRNHAHLSAVGFTTAGDNDPVCGMLKADNIRVTSSAFNGFTFLYHVVFQLCVVSQAARNQERVRLTNLFEQAIRRGNPIQKVNPRDLFNF